MKKVIVFGFGLFLCTTNYSIVQNNSVSSEDEKNISNDVVAYNLSNNIKLKETYPYTKFCNDYQEVAIYYHIECGIPTSIQLAQAIAESGGGASDIAKVSNNLFGMKYYKELYSGDYYTSPTGTKWRKYNSIEDSFKDHAEFLYKFYPHAVGKDWKFWVNNCKGYGGEGYWSHIGMVVEKFKLWQYDEIVNNHKQKQNYAL
jgi:hypothetical protein